MSELKAELIKIIVDKGLLAIIILAIAFYLTRAIERYKAKNTYYQKLSETKLEAFQEINGLLTLQTDHLIQIVNILKDSMQEPGSKQKVYVTKLVKAHKTLEGSFHDMRIAYLKHSIFFSLPLAEALGKSIDTAREFSNLLHHPENLENPREGIREIGELILSHCVDAKSMLREEINRSPFD